MPKKSKNTKPKPKAATTDKAAAALLEIHRGLWPENYDAEHEGSTEWNSGTIEWVAADIERALRGIGHPAARFTEATR